MEILMTKPYNILMLSEDGQRLIRKQFYAANIVSAIEQAEEAEGGTVLQATEASFDTNKHLY